MEDINTRSVRYPLAVDQKFEKIALKLGRTKRQLFIQMIDYFYKSKKDPADLNDELLKNTLMKNHQQYIGFIRTQEDMLLIPIKTEVDRVSVSQGKIIERFNSEVLEHNVTMLNNQNDQAKAIVEIGGVLDMILKAMHTKKGLKEQFLLILDGYIRSRDGLGLMTSGREKEELVTVTKEQVKLL